MEHEHEHSHIHDGVEHPHPHPHDHNHGDADHPHPHPHDHIHGDAEHPHPHPHDHIHGEGHDHEHIQEGEDMTLAMLRYMLDHNVHHCAELKDLAEKISGEAQHQLLHAIEDFEASNEHLGKAVELLKQK